MKKGQRVLVWSLQSFHGGGFLNGAPAFLRQSSDGSGSVVLCVIRNMRGNSVIDESYEVYQQQVQIVEKCNWPADIKLIMFRKIIMQDDRIC